MLLYLPLGAKASRMPLKRVAYMTLYLPGDDICLLCRHDDSAHPGTHWSGHSGRVNTTGSVCSCLISLSGNLFRLHQGRRRLRINCSLPVQLVVVLLTLLHLFDNTLCLTSRTGSKRGLLQRVPLKPQ